MTPGGGGTAENRRLNFLAAVAVSRSIHYRVDGFRSIQYKVGGACRDSLLDARFSGVWTRLYERSPSHSEQPSIKL